MEVFVKLAIWVTLNAFFLSSADCFSKLIFCKKLFQEYHQSVKQFGCRSGQTISRPDLGPNCWQRLSADDTRRQE